MLTNREVIAIDQDPLGKQGDRVSAQGPLEIWTRTLADGSKAVGLFNRHPQPLTIHLDFPQVGFNGKVKVRDIWQAKDLGTMQGTYETLVPGHGVVLLKVASAR